MKDYNNKKMLNLKYWDVTHFYSWTMSQNVL